MTNNCIEGKPEKYNEQLIIIFEKMSSFTSCDIIINTPQNNLKIHIYSNDRSVYDNNSDNKNYIMFVLFLIILVIIMSFLLIYTLPETLIDGLLKWRFCRENKTAKCYKKIQDEFYQTYGLKIDYYDVLILCAIANDKYTILEINKTTKIFKTYIKRKIKEWQNKEILTKEKHFSSNVLKTKILDNCGDSTTNNNINEQIL